MTTTAVRPPESVNNTTLELQQDLAQSTPRQCVTLTHSVPSVQMYYALKSKIDNCSEKWLQEFLDLNGLDSLLDSLDQLTGRGFTSFSDAILQLDCIACIRSILNYNTGLEFFLLSDVYTKKLTMALNSEDTLPKKQVFEVLSVISVYSHIGYLRVLEGLSYFKSECDQLHRFSVVVSDLQRSETVANKTAILTFINTMINCTPDVTERLRIRNEFIGLNLLDVLTFMRKEEPDEDLLLQLEVFHERKLSDEESVNAENNLDFNSPQDLLDQIQSRVFGTPRMVNFVNILQDMLAAETVYSDNSLKIWQMLDGLIHHVVHTLDTPKLDTVQLDLEKLPDNLQQGLQCLHSYQPGQNHMCPAVGLKHGSSSTDSCMKGLGLDKLETDVMTEKKQTLCNNGDHSVCDTSCQSYSYTVEKDCDDTVIDCGSDTKRIKPKDEIKDDCEEISNRDQSSHSNDENTENQSSKIMTNQNEDKIECSSSQTLCQARSESSCKKMYENNLNKTDVQQEKSSFDQTKVPDNLDTNTKVSEEKRHSLKTQVSSDGCPNLKVVDSTNSTGDMSLNVKKLNDSSSDNNETYSPSHQVTVKKEIPTGPSPTKSVYNLKWITLSERRIAKHDKCVWLSPICDQIKPDFTSLETMFATSEKTCMIEEVVLLNVTTRLNINLFLSRLDSGAEELVHDLEEGDPAELSLAMLQYLNKILPCTEEISMLCGYKGARMELGMAEQFVLLLSDIPDYVVLLEGHLMRAEFEAGVKEFNSSLTLMIDVSRVVLKNSHLKLILHLILDIGNFLNHGSFMGGAAGFKLSTLERLQEVKSKVPCKTLLHHLVQAISEDDSKMLINLMKELLPLDKASSCSVEEMKSKISTLNAKLRTFIKNLSTAGPSVQAKFGPFISSLKKEYVDIQSKTTELRTLSDQLAEYFCEDGATFNIHEAFKCLLTFCKGVKKCLMENFLLTRQQQLAKKKGDALHKRLKTKLLSLEFGENAGASSSMMEEKQKVVEKMLDQLHRGSFHPHIAKEPTTPDNDLHPLEMSCIPFEGSPGPLRGTMGVVLNDTVFLDTPDIAGAPKSRVRTLSRSSTQKMGPPMSVCTAQTSRPLKTGCYSNLNPEFATSTLTKQSGVPLNKQSSPPFDMDVDGLESNPQKKLFQASERPGVGSQNVRNQKPSNRQIELPRRQAGHRRSRSDLSDSVCAVNKWIKYEAIRNTETQEKRAPLANPESNFNISTLNLESKGKFLTDQELQRLKPSQTNCDEDIRNLTLGPTVKLPEVETRDERKLEKKSSVGGFWSKIGRAVLRPRNVYSDGDQPDGVFKRSESSRRSKKFIFSAQEKENVGFDRQTSDDKLSLEKEDKKGKAEQGKVSRFLRGGLYRSSKMKGRSKKESV